MRNFGKVIGFGVDVDLPLQLPMFDVCFVLYCVLYMELWFILNVYNEHIYAAV